MTSSLKMATCTEKRESAEMETLKITSRQGHVRVKKKKEGEEEGAHSQG